MPKGNLKFKVLPEREIKIFGETNLVTKICPGGWGNSFIWQLWKRIGPTSAFLIFHGGNSSFINSFDKTNFLFHSPTDAAPQFL